MKVLLLDVHFGGSSTGKLVASLAAGLKVRGHEVLALYGRGPRQRQEGVVRIAPTWEFFLHVLAARLTGWNGVFSWIATRRFIAQLHRFRPDVIHLHELHGYYLNIYRVMHEIKALGIPTVWTFHCEYMYTGKCGYAMNCEKWKTECHDCPQLHEYPQSWFLDFTRTMFRKKRKAFEDFHRLTITCPSEWLSNRVRLSMLADWPVQTVFNGVDVQIFRPSDTSALRQELNIPQEASVMMCVGADLLSARKGGQWALQLAQQMVDRHVVLVMVGVQEPLPQVPANVRMVPPVRDQARLAAYYSLGDVLLLTSEKETFSMVCAESLACGTPVIGFDSGAPKEVAPPGYGAFVPYGDLMALERRLREFLDQRDILASRDACVALAQERYADSVMVSRFETLYRSMCADKANGIQHSSAVSFSAQ